MPLESTLYARSNESLEGINTPDFMSLVTPKLESAITLSGLQRRLEEGEPLNVKFGTDPTGPELHLGHMVPMRLLDIFRRAGHNIDILFGDFTAQIGDPSGRTEMRATLSTQQIETNMADYTNQINGYLKVDGENVRTYRNSNWLGQMALAEAMSFMQSVSLAEATQRKDFRERMSAGQSVSLAEAMYGTLTGIDSVNLESDVEIGGIDQLLNFQQARMVQNASGQPQEEILMTPILVGIAGDGRKMSKSFGNYIPAGADANEMFGKVMSIPDELIMPYWTAFAPISAVELKNVQRFIETDPLESKKQLASYLVSVSKSSSEAGDEAREEFEKRFSKRDYQSIQDVEKVAFGDEASIVPTLASARDTSNSQILRLFKAGAVKVIDENNSPKTAESPADLLSLITPGCRVKIGRQILQPSTIENIN